MEGLKIERILKNPLKLSPIFFFGNRFVVKVSDIECIPC
jgi:tRNA(Glu) U13 pseudouridine synthase TruD